MSDPLDEFDRRQAETVARYALQVTRSDAFKEALRAARSFEVKRTLDAAAAHKRWADLQTAKVNEVQTVLAARMARQLSASLVPLRDPMARMLDNPAVRAQLVRLARAAEQGDAVQTAIDDDLDQLERFADGEGLDSAVLAEFESGLVSDDEMGDWVEAQTQGLLARFPRLSRASARKVVVVVAFLMCVGVMTGVSFIPGVGGALGALGVTAPAAGRAAGKAFDKYLPPDETDPPQEPEASDATNGPTVP